MIDQLASIGLAGIGVVVIGVAILAGLFLLLSLWAAANRAMIRMGDANERAFQRRAAEQARTGHADKL